MPIYEYNCPRCGTFETTQRITEAPLKRCPTCKSKVERMLSRTSFILKGSGWYATDYGRSGKSGESTGESSTAKDTAAAKPASDSGSTGSTGKPSADKSASASTTEKSTTAK
jgi:putative FmdB family regulatory protein